MTTSLIASRATTIGLLAGKFVIIYFISFLVFYLLFVISLWKLFTKAGEKGWKAIIPFYNFYVICKLTWAPIFFWITTIAHILVSFSGLMMSIFLLMVSWNQLVIWSFLNLFVWIFVIVFTIITQYRLSKAYGHGGGYTVGLIFLNFIFMLILGFGKSKYQGNVYLKDKKKKKK